MMAEPSDDQVISVIPIHFSNALAPNVQLHQFPLLTRPLQVPPSAAASGKRIRARRKPNAQRLEVHVPVDTRTEVWNVERSKELGTARAEDDKEKNQEGVKLKQREDEEPRLTEIRLRSERVPQVGAYVLGTMRDGKLYLHPISEAHQLRPTLTYMDVLHRKTKRRGGDGGDSDSDEGPPPDPDEPLSAPSTTKKEKKPVGEPKEVQVAVRKTDDKGMQFGSGITPARREMLMQIRAEEEEKWEDYEYYDGEAAESEETFNALFSHNDEVLQCKTDITTMLKDIKGL